QGAEDTLKHRTFDLSSQRCFTSEAKWHDSRPKCPVLGGTAAGCTTALSASDNPRPGTMDAPEHMTSTEVEALQAKLAKSERNRQKLRDSLALLKERALNTVELVQQHGALKALVSSEQEARALAEQALTAERSAAQAQIQALGRRLDDLVSAQRAEREAVLTESGARRAPDAALDVVARLESTALEPSCPPALLLVGWETALLGCAAAVCRGGPGAATAAAPWFEAAPGDSAARGPTFSVCWMTAEARTCNAFPKLLRAAQELSRRLERAAPGVWAAPRDGTATGAGGLGAEDAGAASLLARLRQRLHRRLLCSLACGEGEEGLSPSEHAALAAGTAALARCQGSVQALRCLVLDLLCLLDGRGPAGGRARALLPPLTAALDMWPAALAPQSADPLGDRVLAGLRALLRAAHSHPGPPSTSLLQTPGLEAAAREGLLALGRAHWGWAGCGEGGGAATTEENGQPDDDSDPGVDEDLAPVSAVLTDWLAGGDKPSPIPASNDSDTPV
ncbi:hypothetical protein APUTEX25_005535, partial [Auxenochlorella protothecoides]